MTAKEILKAYLSDLRTSDPYRASMFARWKWGNPKVHGTIAIISDCKAGRFAVSLEIDSTGKVVIVY
jgi:hypothetical protein